MCTNERLEALWRDARNWYWLHTIYWCPEDPRVWVPKPIKWTGWTLNFAHSSAWWWLAALLSPAALTLLMVALSALAG